MNVNAPYIAPKRGERLTKAQILYPCDTRGIFKAWISGFNEVTRIPRRGWVAQGYEIVRYAYQDILWYSGEELGWFTIYPRKAPSAAVKRHIEKAAPRYGWSVVFHQPHSLSRENVVTARNNAWRHKGQAVYLTFGHSLTLGPDGLIRCD